VLAWPGSLNPDPDVQVPESSSIKEACEKFFVADAAADWADSHYKPKILEAAQQMQHRQAF